MRTIRPKNDTALRRRLYTPDSWQHPAKGHLGLWAELIEMYSNPGDTILDPMAGVGATLIAALMGRNVICVELEPHFVEPMRASWEKMRTMPMLGYELGQASIVQGDARDLGAALADHIITSPPWEDKTGQITDWVTEQKATGTLKTNERGDPWANKRYTEGYTRPDAILTSPPFQDQVPAQDPDWWNKHRKELSSRGPGPSGAHGYTRPPRHTPGKDDILGVCNTPVQSVDGQERSRESDGGVLPAIVGLSKHGGPQTLKKSFSKSNDGLPIELHGNQDTRLTESGSVASETAGQSSLPTDVELTGSMLAMSQQKNSAPSSNGTRVVASIAEAQSNAVAHLSSQEDLTTLSADLQVEGIPPQTSSSAATPVIATRPNKIIPVLQGGGNVGNERGAKYWLSMSSIYAECFRVLRPGGLMALVLKGFTRTERRKTAPKGEAAGEWQHEVETIAYCVCGHIEEEHAPNCLRELCLCREFVLAREERMESWVKGGYVDLPGQTEALLLAAGWEKHDHWRRQLWALSFWRVLQKRRDPAAFDDRLMFEEVLCFRKPLEADAMTTAGLRALARGL